MKDYKSNIKKLYLMYFLRGLHFIGGVLIPFYTIWGGINLTQVLLLQSWFMIWVFLLEVPTGTVADKFGRKASLALGSLIGAIAPIVYASYPLFTIFLVGEFLWALSAALFSGANDALLYDTLKKVRIEKESKKFLPKARSIGMSGILIAAPIGSVIAHFWGFRITMLLMAIPIFIAFLVSLTLKEPPAARKKEKYFKLLKDGMKFFAKHRILKFLALDMIVISSLAFMIIWLYQPMLMNFGIEIAYFGIVTSLIVLSQIIVMNRFSWLEKIVGGKRRYIFFSALIPGLMFILAGATGLWYLFIAAAIIITGFGLSRGPLFSSYMNKFIPSSKRATVLSTISMFQTIGMAILYPIIGRLSDWSVNYTLIIIGAVIILFSLVSKVEEDMLID